MGLRFLHTADWQIGMKATHVAAVADVVRRARLETAERIVRLAKDQEVDFLLIAGDLFEDNAVGNDVVHQVVRILEQAAPVRVYILPGNHDLLTPGSVYERPAFRRAGANVHVLRTAEPVRVRGKAGEAVLLPAPITQKRSETDPTTQFRRFEASGDGDGARASDSTCRIGVAHGSPRIEGMYKPDDHPIALNAAARYGLDYLALGHWHSWLALGERMLMPGTPEPTKFGEESGFAALVALEEAGTPPRMEQLGVQSLHWTEAAFRTEVGHDALERQVRAWVEGLEQPEKQLMRIQLFGPMTTETETMLLELEDWLAARTLHVAFDMRRTTPSLTEGRLREVAAAHPFLAGLLTDLAKLSGMAEPEALGYAEAAASGDGPSLAEALSADELRALLREHDLELDPDVIKEAIRQLAHRAGEVWQ